MSFIANMNLTRKAKKIWVYVLTLAMVLTAVTWPTPQKAAAAGAKFYWLNEEQTDITVLDEDAETDNTITLKNTALDNIGYGYIDDVNKSVTATGITLTVNDTYTFDYPTATVESVAGKADGAEASDPDDRQKLDFANKWGEALTMEDSENNAVLKMVKWVAADTDAGTEEVTGGLELTVDGTETAITGYTITFKTKQLEQVTAPSLADGVCFEWVGSWTKQQKDTNEQISFLTKEGYTAEADMKASSGAWQLGFSKFSLDGLTNPTLAIEYVMTNTSDSLQVTGSTSAGKSVTLTSMGVKSDLAGVENGKKWELTLNGTTNATITSFLLSSVQQNATTVIKKVTVYEAEDVIATPTPTPKPTPSPTPTPFPATDADEGVYLEWTGEWTKKTPNDLKHTTLALSADAKGDDITWATNNNGWLELNGLDLSAMSLPKVYVEYTREGAEEVSVCKQSWKGNLIDAVTTGTDATAILETSLKGLIFTSGATSVVFTKIKIYEGKDDPVPTVDADEGVYYQWSGNWSKNSFFYTTELALSADAKAKTPTAASADNTLTISGLDLSKMTSPQLTVTYYKGMENLVVTDGNDEAVGSGYAAPYVAELDKSCTTLHFTSTGSSLSISKITIDEAEVEETPTPSPSPSPTPTPSPSPSPTPKVVDAGEGVYYQWSGSWSTSRFSTTELALSAEAKTKTPTVVGTNTELTISGLDLSKMTSPQLTVTYSKGMSNLVVTDQDGAAVGSGYATPYVADLAKTCTSLKFAQAGSGLSIQTITIADKAVATPTPSPSPTPTATPALTNLKFYWLGKEMTDITVLAQDAATANTITLPKSTDKTNLGYGYINNVSRSMTATDIVFTVNDTYTFEYGKNVSSYNGRADGVTSGAYDRQKLDFPNQWGGSMTLNEKNSKDNAVFQLTSSGLTLVADTKPVTITGYTITFKTKQLEQKVTATPSPTPGGTATATPGGTATATPGGTATATPGGTATATPGGTATATPGGTATATPVPVQLGENDYLIWEGSWKKTGNGSTWGKTDNFVKAEGSNAVANPGAGSGWNWNISGLDLSGMDKPTVEVEYARNGSDKKVQVAIDSNFTTELRSTTSDKFTAVLDKTLTTIYFATTESPVPGVMEITRVRIYDDKTPDDPNVTPKPTIKPLEKDEYMKWEGSWKKGSEDNETTGFLKAEGSEAAAALNAGGGWWWNVTGLDLSGMDSPILEVGFKLAGADRLQVFKTDGLQAEDEMEAVLVSEGVYQVALAKDMTTIWFATADSGTSEITSLLIYDDTVEHKKAKLTEDITAAEALNQADYTEASWTTFQTALAAAKTAAAKADATAEEIKTASDALAAAIKGLVAAGTATPTPTPGGNATPSPTPTPGGNATPTPTPKPPTGSQLTVGSTFTAGKFKYKVTAANTVAVQGPKSKTAKSLSIPATVKMNGVTCKVTSIANNAFKNCKKLKSITIGANVATIGKNAFSKAKALKKITVKSKKLKKVGKGALKGIHKKAVIKVPKAQLKKYKKLFKGKGQKKTVKIKK